MIFSLAMTFVSSSSTTDKLSLSQEIIEDYAAMADCIAVMKIDWSLFSKQGFSKSMKHMEDLVMAVLWTTMDWWYLDG